MEWGTKEPNRNLWSSRLCRRYAPKSQMFYKSQSISAYSSFYGRVVPESQLCPGRIPGRKGYDATCDVIQAKSVSLEL
ncbi:unnamed protein product [Strongylus vulgaris]|uniref:Uncharacterized protein n=1 Tax=Strongylus vulgaris TaxID=40348 RepID=A0A3P7JU16_STRVU|nr:unnamed protein product [Strongylus vulgaris]